MASFQIGKRWIGEANYNEPRGLLPANARSGFGIRHVNFCLKLKEKMDKLGLKCSVRHLDEGAKPGPETIEFFSRHLLTGKPCAITTTNR